MSGDPLGEGLREALGEFGVTLTSSDAEHALGRLSGLQYASALGLRPARRALSRERPALLDRCARATALGTGDEPQES